MDKSKKPPKPPPLPVKPVPVVNLTPNIRLTEGYKPKGKGNGNIIPPKPKK